MSTEAVLVVEDEAIVALEITHLLTELGYRVLGPVSTGADAVARCAEERADIALMDIRLCGPLDGIETAALLRARYRVPAVYLTAHADTDTLRRAASTAPFSYVTKPFRELDLHAAIQTSLHRHRLEVALDDARQQLEQRVAQRTDELRGVNEELRREIAERARAENELRRANDTLEQRVAERTAELAANAERLRIASAEWRATFDALDPALVLVDADARIVRLNESARRLSGSDFGELVGLPLRDLAPEELWPMVAAVAFGPVETRRQLTRIPGRASGRTWEVRVGEVHPSLPGCRVVSATDVTATVQLEILMRRQEAMAAIGTIASGVAHEVRGPLFALSANLDALELCGDPVVLERAKPLRRSVARLNTLMEALLDFARSGSALLQPAALLDVVREAAEDCRAVASETGISIVVHCDSPWGSVATDRERLRQVFVNVIQNALHHSPGTAAVDLRCEATSRDGRPWLRCTVTDRGPGFRAEDLGRVFEPFFTRRKGGTGLGLAIARRIIDAHGGLIEAGNAASGGGCVTVLLPVHGT